MPKKSRARQGPVGVPKRSGIDRTEREAIMAGFRRRRRRFRRHHRRDASYASDYAMSPSRHRRRRRRLSYRTSHGGRLSYAAPRRDSAYDAGARSWPDDHRGHSKASRLGWRRRKSKRRARRGRRDASYATDYAMASSPRRRRRRRRSTMGYGPSRRLHHSGLGLYSAERRSARRSWPDDFRGHSTASRKGWRRRKHKTRRRSSSRRSSSRRDY